MRNAIFAIALLLATPFGLAMASGHEPETEDADIDLTDHASLQRGAKYFMNYCLGCHSLKYMRYSRVAQDIGISDSDLRNNLLYGNAKPGDMITNSMRPEDGELWFGAVVPDLTLVARWRTPDWVYTYLKSFYLDDSRPYGVNNLMFPDVGMPPVLSGLQGIQEPVYAEGYEPAPGAPVDKAHVIGVKLVKQGSLTPEQYDAMARDLTNFLTYIGEPMKLQRQQLGIYVLLFLGVLFVLAFYLKKEYWKDVH
ncbi:cytochrome c1 [Thiospirillum jenense]|uniref:Cytochrome c1 n=1 Tax=Thiospirillum jenense TaxID=1653858 RepID=A0A839HMH1_9GAMM|nr:cytochrome c1 [Thiospirillum jenense]MBB1126722.1 cytochrome c1 [Thiospirillum jenense]